MTTFTLGNYPKSSILLVYAERDKINISPDYQRIGGVWSINKRQLLIDSLINGFDVPKFYFHKVSGQTARNRYQYAIVDGQQRLHAIWDFIDDELPIAKDFSFLADESVDMVGLKYSEIARRYPLIKARFDATLLDIVTIETDDMEAIEDLFSRLNEAVPLNAPEKRNALGGPLPAEIANLSRHSFFTKHVPFPNGRYRHRDLATKFLFVEHVGGLTNTKKADLDSFVRNFKKRREAGDPRGALLEVDSLFSRADSTLSLMGSVFLDRDPLLRQVGMITLYYHLFRGFRAKRETDIDRDMLQKFEELRMANRKVAEDTDEADSQVDADLLEFDTHSQTPNDAYALRIRLDILLRLLKADYYISYEHHWFEPEGRSGT